MSLIISNVEHVFKYLLLCISSLEKCLLRSFTYILIWVICLFVTQLQEFLAYFNINSLPDIWFASIFSYSIGCLFTLLIILLYKGFLVKYNSICLFLAKILLKRQLLCCVLYTHKNDRSIFWGEKTFGQIYGIDCGNHSMCEYLPPKSSSCIHYFLFLFFSGPYNQCEA